MRDSRDRAALSLLALTAAFLAVRLWVSAARNQGVSANDVYSWTYPSAVYAWRAIRQGTGLLWNPYQDCGQPFLGITQVGVFYPLNVLYLLLDREPALVAGAFLHFSIAGAGIYLLCRQLGLHAPAALCSAVTFQLAGTTLDAATITPIVMDTYAWLPVAAWRCECLVQRPTTRRSILLAAVLTLQLLRGFPQMAFFTYQVIALRIAWSLLTREARQPVRLLASVGFAVVLPVFLTAIQLLPSIEVARASLRSLPLAQGDIGPGFGWGVLWAVLRLYSSREGNFLVIVLALVALLTRPGKLRRHVAFYAAVVGVYFVLSLGPGSPLFDLYSRLPLGTAFRGSARLQWVVTFALAILAGIGAESVLSSARAASSRLALVGVIAATALLQWFAPTGRWSDALLALVLLAAVALSFRPRPASPAGATAVLLVAAVAANWTIFAPPILFSLRHGDLYGPSADAFAFVRARITPQDRINILGHYGLSPDFAMVQKTAMLYEVPAIYDYEPLASRSYAEFFTFMRKGRGVRHLDDWYWSFEKVMSSALRRPLFDLTAARYILVDRALDRTPEVLGPSARLLAEVGYIRIYENGQALSRARYVPRIAAVAENEILPRMVAPGVDYRRIAFVDSPPRSGFLGVADEASGTADIVVNEAEHVVIRVSAPAPGFLYLADQYFPGWTARVNGTQTEILRANYTFRVVEVPAGESEVVFDYRPASFSRGRLISLVTLAAVVLLWLRTARGGAARDATDGSE